MMIVFGVLEKIKDSFFAKRGLDCGTSSLKSSRAVSVNQRRQLMLRQACGEVCVLGICLSVIAEAPLNQMSMEFHFYDGTNVYFEAGSPGQPY
jgi:hypothetical protein